MLLKRQLILEDGSIFVGNGFGSEEKHAGEVVFNTGMTGYQEILTDPSYCAQIIVFTYPLIGNYGINKDDFETLLPSVGGVIVKENAERPSNWRSHATVDQFLKEKGIPGISGIDTRKLTKIIRKYGTMKGKICSIEEDPKQVVQELQHMTLMTNAVQLVSTKTPYVSPGDGYRIAVIDFGMKHGILRELNKRGFDVIVLPYDTTAEHVLSMNPAGVMLTNGPGDPKDVPEAVEMINHLLGKVPIFGICLGHQLFALAAGANTEKMKFGHRGANHPVMNLETSKVALTSQNHGYTVQAESLRNLELEVTYKALNDGTIEGLRHTVHPAFTVQFHPEASAGPHDANDLFDEFLELIAKFKKGGAACQNEKTFTPS